MRRSRQETGELGEQEHTWSGCVSSVVLSVVQVQLVGVQLLHDARHVAGDQLQRAGGGLGLLQHGCCSAWSPRLTWNNSKAQQELQPKAAGGGAPKCTHLHGQIHFRLCDFNLVCEDK